MFWGATMPTTTGREGVLRHHPLMASVTAAVVAVGLVIALAAGPIYRFCGRAAAGIVDPSTYSEAVQR